MAEQKKQLERRLEVVVNRLQDIDLENELCRAAFEGERVRGGDGTALMNRMNQLRFLHTLFVDQGVTLQAALKGGGSPS